MSLGHVDLLWLVAGVVLHLSSQLARGRGWHSVVCSAHPEGGHPRRRDVLLTWIAGAGASGVLSARGGDALRIVLLRRRMTTTCPRLVGTLAAETVAETILGALLTVWALSAGLIPGLHRPGLATAALIAAGALALFLVAAAAGTRRVPALARACADARRGLVAARQPRLLPAPRRVVERAQPRAADRLAAVHARRLRAPGHADRRARRDGRPQLRPARAVRPRRRGAASLGLLVAAFPAVTHITATAGEITAFYLGATGTLTAVGIVLSGLILVRELGLAGARTWPSQALERLRVPRKAPVRVPAA